MQPHRCRHGLGCSSCKYRPQIEAVLARIKYYRNSVYGHVDQNMEITDDEFPLLWQEISEALLGIAGQINPQNNAEWQKAIDKFLKDPLTAEDERHVEELLRWYINDTEVKEYLVKLNSSVQTGMEHLETSIQEGLQITTRAIDEKSQHLETTVQEKAQSIKDQL